MPALLSILGPVAAFTFIVYWTVTAYIQHGKLRQFKGPPIAAWTGLWMAKQAVSANMPTAQMDALRKYGSPARIGPNMLVTDDPELLRHMSAPRSKWTRGGWYDGVKLDPRMNNILSERDEKKHAEMRSMMIGAYSGREVETLEADIDTVLLRFLDLIKRNYNGKVMDMAQVASYFTLDVLSLIAFGESFGFLDADADLYEFHAIANQFFGVLELVVNHENLRSFIQSRFIQKLIAPKGTDKVGQGAIIGIAKKAVAERYGQDAKKRKDMLGHFISKGMAQEQAEVESHLQILAGADSTSGVLRITMMLLVGNPTAYHKLRTEIEAAVAEGKISYPVVKYSEAAQLEFLQAIIWEALRMYPPLFGLQSKRSPPEGDTVNGIFFPPGVEIAICDEGLGRRRDVFGPDADIFRPERWLNPDPAVRAKYLKHVEVVFGSGRFVCLGKSIAFMELSKAIVELVRTFDWSVADAIRGPTSIAHGIWVHENMNLVAWPRQ